MKTNQGAIVLAERAADYGRLRSVLREWGYEETDIQRVLKERRPSREQEESDERTSQLIGKDPPRLLFRSHRKSKLKV